MVQFEAEEVTNRVIKLCRTYKETLKSNLTFFTVNVSQSGTDAEVLHCLLQPLKQRSGRILGFRNSADRWVRSCHNTDVHRESKYSTDTISSNKSFDWWDFSSNSCCSHKWGFIDVSVVLFGTVCSKYSLSVSWNWPTRVLSNNSGVRVNICNFIFEIDE